MFSVYCCLEGQPPAAQDSKGIHRVRIGASCDFFNLRELREKDTHTLLMHSFRPFLYPLLHSLFSLLSLILDVFLLISSNSFILDVFF